MVDATITKRLHVGGITPAITTSHIKDRFSSFGTVQDVEELGPDAMGQPRPFTFLTLQTTPAQLKKCLNILSGSFWRGTQLRLSEAKPNYTTKYKEPILTNEEKRKVLLKKRKRVESSRGEDVGKLSQDIRLVNEKIAKKKKFWIVDENDTNDELGAGKRILRPITIRPTHPIGKPSILQSQVDKKEKEKEKSGRKRITGPPERLRRRVINPIVYGSIYITGDQLLSGGSDQEEIKREEGEWVFEEYDEENALPEGQEEVDEDGKSIIGIWKKLNSNGDIIEQNIVRGQKRVSPIEEDLESDYGLDLPTHGEASSPLFGNRNLPSGGDENRDGEREESPLFPSRNIVNEDVSTTASNDIEQNGSSPLFPTRNIELEQRERSASPLFPTRDNRTLDQKPPSSPLFPTLNNGGSAKSIAAEQPSSPLFPTRPAHEINQPDSDSDGENEVEQASSPLFPTRTAIRSPSPVRLPSPPPPMVVKKPVVQPKINLPTQILASARAERSSALGVLGSLIRDLSPPVKKEKVVWEVYPESDDEDEVEIGRGRTKSIQAEAPTVVEQKIEDPVVIELKEPALDIPIDEEPVDASSSSSSSGSNSSSGSSGSSGDEDDKMDVDPPADGKGDDKEESSSSGSGSSSSGSGGGSGSGDDDDDDDSSSESDSSDSETDDESDEDSEEEEDGDEAANKGTTEPIVPKTSGLKDMFAPTTSSSLNFGSTSNTTGGFSLLANFGQDIEIDEDMDIPLPLDNNVENEEHTGKEEELQPLPLSISSGRGKIKFDATSSSEIPLFFDIPTTNEASSSTQTRKGESRNLYNELHNGIPTSIEDENGDMVEGEPTKLPGFNRLNGETDEGMKQKWENEKLELTQGWKKRFREAKKSKRRRGGEEVD